MGLAALAWGTLICGTAAAGQAGEAGSRPETPAAKATAAATCPVKPTGKDYSGQNLTDHDFSAAPAGALVGANFAGATLEGAVFAEQDLTGASFEGAHLGPSAKGPADFTGAKLQQTCFIGATLNAARLGLATFRCADFTGTSLLEADFGPVGSDAPRDFGPIPGKSCRTSFREATLDVHVVPTRYWKYIDFTRTRFQNATPNLFDLRGADASGALLAGVRLPGIDMTGANLAGADLSGAHLLKAVLDRAALQGAILDGAYLYSASLVCARFYGQGRVEDAACACDKSPCTPRVAKPAAPASLASVTLHDADLSHAVLDYAHLTGATMPSVTARGASFVHANLEGGATKILLLGADLSGATFDQARLNGVSFNKTLLPGAHFDHGTTLNQTTFDDSIMPGASFDQAKLENTSFDDTILQEAKFTGTTIAGANFACAQLGGASFANATITGANFSDAVMPSAGSCCPSAKGTTFRWCGTVELTGSRYGPVTYPVLSTAVTCPNPLVGNARCACRKRADGSLDCSDWEIPDWQAQCGSGPVETVWRQPPCGSPPTDLVHFADPNLERCVLASLPGRPSYVTVETAAKVRRVVCPGRGISKLGGLEKFTGLTHLDLSANDLTQFSFPKVEFAELQSLLLSDNRLTLLDVASATSLARLEAANNKLSAVDHAGLPPLEFLDLSGNSLATFDLPIYSDTLLWADLSDNQLTQVLGNRSDLSRLDGLVFLDLSGNSLKTIGSVANLATNFDRDDSGDLQSLFLACNPAFDCRTLDLPLNDGNDVPAVGTSRCAAFNSQAGAWILEPHPTCPPGA